MDLLLVYSALVTLFISFCAGFLLFHFLKIPMPSDWNFALLFPLHVALGMICLVAILTSLSIVYLDFLVSCLVTSLLLASFVLVVRKKVSSLRSAVKNLRDFRFSLPLLLLGFSLCRFVYLTVNMGWAPYVDSQTHGMYTSLILYHRGLPSSYHPLGEMPFDPVRYPLGYHVLGAFVSMLTGSYPGQSILVVGTVIVLLLPSLLYTMVYFHSKSLRLSFLAFLLAYFLPGNSPASWRPSHDLLLGNFLVGTYPNMLGNLVFLTFVIVAADFDGLLQCSLRKICFLYGLLIAALSASYYPLLPFLFLFLFLRVFVQTIRKQQMTIRTYLKIVGSLVAVGVCFLVLIDYKPVLAAMFHVDSSLCYSAYMRYSLFSLESTYTIYTILISIAAPISLWLLLRNKLRNLGLSFLVLFIPLMLAQNEQIYSSLMWFTEPDRALILLVICSYNVILGGFHVCTHMRSTLNRWFNVFNRVKLKLRIKKGKKVQFKLIHLTMVFAFVLFIPSLLSHVTYSYPEQYQAALPHGNDLEALRWLADNVDSEELVLNDRTVMGYWITSFKVMNVINDRDIILKIFLFHSLNGTYLADRTLEVNEILDNPWDYAAFDEIANKYGLSYIYISENPTSLPLARGRWFLPFPWKNLTQEERIIIYLGNPRLKIAYRSGNAVIFKVETNSRE